jgi:small-conductance mechanosensitive channel
VSALRLIFLLIQILWLSAISVAAQEPEAAEAVGVPVIFEDKTLFRVYSPLATYRPEERAAVTTSRLYRLAQQRDFRPETLNLVEKDRRTDIVAGESSISSVTDEDARAEGRSRQEMAGERLQIIRDVILEYRRRHSASSIAMGVVYSLLSTLTLIIVLLSLIRFRLWFSRYSALYLQSHLPAGRVHGLRHLTVMTSVHFLRYLIPLVTSTIATALVPLYLILLFGFFPWTQTYSQSLQAYLMQQIHAAWNAFLTKLPDLVFILVIFFITWVLLRIIRPLFTGIERGTIEIGVLDPALAMPTYRIVRLLAVAMALVAAYPYIPGSNSAAFQGLSVFIGALLTLGSTSLSANLVSGIVLTYMRAFQPGDYVRIGEVQGTVLEKTGLIVRIRTPKNVIVTIPNAQVQSHTILNFSEMARQGELILHTTVTIGYDVPWRKVHALLIEAARQTEGVLSVPSPFVHQTALNDYHISYQLNAYTALPKNMQALYSELHQNIQDQFAAAGVEILSPLYASMRDGNPSTVPSVSESNNL